MAVFLLLVELVVLGIVVAVPPTICLLKGKQEMAVLGIVAYPVWVLGAIRLAKPESRWARRLYADDKMVRAIARHQKASAAFWNKPIVSKRVRVG